MKNGSTSIKKHISNQWFIFDGFGVVWVEILDVSPRSAPVRATCMSVEHMHLPAPVPCIRAHPSWALGCGPWGPLGGPSWAPNRSRSGFGADLDNEYRKRSTQDAKMAPKTPPKMSPTWTPKNQIIRPKLAPILEVVKKT